MSPMEFGPANVRDFQARRRVQGRAQASEGTATRLEYGLNPDRAWTPAPGEIRMEVLLLTARLQALRGRPMQVRLADRTRTELFTMGVFAAARWTLGNTPQRPMDLVPAPVCDAEVEAQIRNARRVFDAEGDNWAEAFGVWMWLQWLTGGVDVVTFPEDRNPDLLRLVWPTE